MVALFFPVAQSSRWNHLEEFTITSRTLSISILALCADADICQRIIPPKIVLIAIMKLELTKA